MKIEIIIRGSKAKVKLNKEAFNKRFGGLVQYLMSFCNEVSYDVSDKKKCSQKSSKVNK